MVTGKNGENEIGEVGGGMTQQELENVSSEELLDKIIALAVEIDHHERLYLSPETGKEQAKLRELKAELLRRLKILSVWVSPVDSFLAH